MKRRHWLLAPDDVGTDAVVAWLADYPAEWGTAAQGDFIDMLPCTVGHVCGSDSAEVFESLGRYDEAIIAAEADIAHYSCFPPVIVQSLTAVGRSQAKLGRQQEAAAAFEAAIEKARKTEYPLFEMFAHRDYIVHVLDAQDKRDKQMAVLGECIRRMVLRPDEYTTMLGSGIDAEAAIAACK